MKKKPTVILGCDHAGYRLKRFVKSMLSEQGYRVMDVGTNSCYSTDYPDYAAKVCRKMKNRRDATGILVCGTGIGMSIAANRYSHIRAALAHTERAARLARQHNDANVLVLAGRCYKKKNVRRIISVFLAENFARGRHTRRVRKMSRIGG